MKVAFKIYNPLTISFIIFNFWFGETDGRIVNTLYVLTWARSYYISIIIIHNLSCQI